MDRLAHRGVVHVQVVADQANDHLAGVEPDPDLDLGAVLPPQLRQVPPHAVLHRQRGVARSDGVVLVRDWRAEHRHQTVAHQAADRPS